EDGASGRGFEVLVNSSVKSALVKIELRPVVHCVELGGGGLDTPGGGARLLTLIGRKGSLVRMRRLRLRVHGFAGARAELGGALAFGLESRLIGFAAA